jgi:predicted nucleic acid-binding protein
LALEGEVCLLTNRDVLLEAERNLKQKAPEAIPLFRLLMELVSPEIVPDPEPELLRAVLEFVIAKDAIVVAGAIAGKADYLVTFDRKHLIDLPEVSKRSSLPIVLPEVVLRVVRGHGKTRTNCDGSEAD